MLVCDARGHTPVAAPAAVLAALEEIRAESPAPMVSLRILFADGGGSVSGNAQRSVRLRATLDRALGANLGAGVQVEADAVIVPAAALDAWLMRPLFPVVSTAAEDVLI
jgi:hypothetical protein